jgi:hypothetical protein
MIGLAKASARRLAVGAVVAAAAIAIASPVLAKPIPGNEPVTVGNVRPAPVSHTSSSFHWDDALTGAGVAAAVSLLLVLTVLGVRRHVRLAPQASLRIERSL